MLPLILIPAAEILIYVLANAAIEKLRNSD